MATINGKEVTFVERLTGKAWWELTPITTAFAAAKDVGGIDQAKTVLRNMDWDDLCMMVRVMVVSWEFDGRPGDPEVLDAMGPEIMELGTECIKRLSELAPNSGESASAST